MKWSREEEEKREQIFKLKATVMSNMRGDFSRRAIKCFSRRYRRACQLMSTAPLDWVNDFSSPGNLDVKADFIGLADWKPLLHSLAHDNSLRSITIRTDLPLTSFSEWTKTEDKARKSKLPPICTAFVMESLMKTIGQCLGTTETLVTIKLNHLWLKGKDFLGYFAMGLKNCISIQEVDFEHCAVTELGLTKLCYALADRPNVKTMKLVNCNITTTMALHISHLIKTQKIRKKKGIYSGGLENIILNENPSFGDDGLETVADGLYDNTFVKVVELQNCGLTNAGAEIVLKLIRKNRRLVAIDIRRNADVGQEYIKTIEDTLRANNQETAKLELNALGQTLTSAILLGYNETRVNGHKELSSPVFSVREEMRKSREASWAFPRTRRNEEDGPLQQGPCNPFARINEESVNSYTSLTKVKFFKGKEADYTKKSAFQHILDGTVQELFDAMEPGQTCKHLVVTPFGKGTDISVKEFTNYIIPKSERGKFANAFEISVGFNKGLMKENQFPSPRMMNKSHKTSKDFQKIGVDQDDFLLNLHRSHAPLNGKESVKMSEWNRKYRDLLVSKAEHRTQEINEQNEQANATETLQSDKDPNAENIKPRQTSKSQISDYTEEDNCFQLSPQTNKGSGTSVNKEARDAAPLSADVEPSSQTEQESKVNFEENKDQGSTIPQEDNLRVPKHKRKRGPEGWEKEEKESDGVNSGSSSVVHTINLGEQALKKLNQEKNNTLKPVSLAVPKAPRATNKIRGPIHKVGCSHSLSKEVGQTLEEKLRWARETFGLEENSASVTLSLPLQALDPKGVFRASGTHCGVTTGTQGDERSLCMVEKRWQMSPTSKSGNIVFFRLEKDSQSSSQSPSMTG